MSVKRVILYVELKPGEAAGLKRLADNRLVRGDGGSVSGSAGSELDHA